MCINVLLHTKYIFKTWYLSQGWYTGDEMSAPCPGGGGCTLNYPERIVVMQVVIPVCSIFCVWPVRSGWESGGLFLLMQFIFFRQLSMLATQYIDRSTIRHQAQHRLTLVSQTLLYDQEQNKVPVLVLCTVVFFIEITNNSFEPSQLQRVIFFMKTSLQPF